MITDINFCTDMKHHHWVVQNVDVKYTGSSFTKNIYWICENCLIPMNEVRK